MAEEEKQEVVEEKTQAEEIEEAEAKKAAEENKDTEKTDEKKSDDADDNKAKGKEEEKAEEKRPAKKEKAERIGVLNIYTTFNNTIMNLTDLSGKSLAKFTGGQSTKQDRLKANPTIAMFIAQRIAEEARDNGITGFYVKVRAKTGQANPGPGTHAAIKSLTRAGFKILSIMDTTHVPRGGPKKKGGRRGRRV
jgi:small subunit ribosomal protein S11